MANLLHTAIDVPPDIGKAMISIYEIDVGPLSERPVNTGDCVVLGAYSDGSLAGMVYNLSMGVGMGMDVSVGEDFLSVSDF